MEFWVDRDASIRERLWSKRYFNARFLKRAQTRSSVAGIGVDATDDDATDLILNDPIHAGRGASE